MRAPRPLRLLLLALLLPALAALARLAAASVQQAVAMGTAEAWLMAWMLAFVLGLPVLMLALPATGWLLGHLRRLGTIPLAGVKIPGAGQ